MYYKHDVVPNEEKGDISYWIKGYIDDLISTMFNNRMEELTQKANPPFIFGYGYYGTFFVSDTKDAWTTFSYAKDKDGIDEALTALVTENKRMQQYGFTASEFERAKADLMKRIENQYDERDKQETNRYFYPILNHFLTNEPLMGIENEYMLLSQILPALPVEAINMYAQELIREDNIVITLTAPEKEGEVLPTKEELLALFNKAKEVEVEAYKETVSNEPLIATLPVKGAIDTKKHDNTFDATILTLKNGVKVIYKPTKFKDDEILMNAFSFGGYSVMDQSDPYTLQEINELATLGGVGNFSAIDLPKVLAGKKASRSTPTSAPSPKASAATAPSRTWRPCCSLLTSISTRSVATKTPSIPTSPAPRPWSPTWKPTPTRPSATTSCLPCTTTIRSSPA